VRTPHCKEYIQITYCEIQSETDDTKAAYEREMYRGGANTEASWFLFDHLHNTQRAYNDKKKATADGLLDQRAFVISV